MRLTTERDSGRRDDGSTLILVLVLILISSFVVLPIMRYTMAVNRAGGVEVDKARGVELAQGGFWVALSYEGELYDRCEDLPGSIPSGLPSVAIDCDVLSTATLRPSSEVPYSIAVVQGDVGGAVPGPASAPPGLGSGSTYSNPNSPADASVWLGTPDYSLTPEVGKVWNPQLPVRATGVGGNRDLPMATDTWDPAYASCRAFFPGTFNSSIELDGPTYFTSGVYYFTEPITLLPGADVVVGNGAAGGCTTDFEAIAGVSAPPDPLNMSGLGGTFVFGENARLIFDDAAGSGDIRFEMNQRYVSETDTSTVASESVSIVSVNGNHEPFDPTDLLDVLESDLVVDGVISTPRSTVGTTGNPFATDSGYLPSVLTPKPKEPEAPTNVQIDPRQDVPLTDDERGVITVTWDVPNDNGALITDYTATASPGGKSCSPATPTLPDTAVQNSCTIEGFSEPSCCTYYTVSVSATNRYGTSPASDASSPPQRVNLLDTDPSSQVSVLEPPSAPQNVSVGSSFSDGLEVGWSESADDGGTPITSYTATATPPGTPGDTSDDVSCTTWWNENRCVLPLVDDPAADDLYLVSVFASTEFDDSVPAELDGDPLDEPTDATTPEPDPVLYEAGPGLAPMQEIDVAEIRDPEAIVDLSTTAPGNVAVKIAGYISVPQGHVLIDAGSNPSDKTVEVAGGVLAAQIHLGTNPSTLNVFFDNPVAQKTVRIRSTASGPYTAVADAVVQVNRSGSVAVNSLVVQ